MTKKELKLKFQKETGRLFEEATHEVMYAYASWLENFIINSLPNGEVSNVSKNEPEK